LAILLLSLPATAADQPAFHVATSGSDDNPGTAEKPFATLDRARRAVRAINANMTGDVVVTVHGGVYRISQTLAFAAADSGTGGHEVIYRAAPGESPEVSGGRPIRGWRPDAGGRWKAATDVADFRQLYVAGQRAIRARSGKLARIFMRAAGSRCLIFPAAATCRASNSWGTTALARVPWR
jgi:hypothetical protein